MTDVPVAKAEACHGWLPLVTLVVLPSKRALLPLSTLIVPILAVAPVETVSELPCDNERSPVASIEPVLLTLIARPLVPRAAPASVNLPPLMMLSVWFAAQENAPLIR